MCYIKKEKVEQAKNEIIERIQVFIDDARNYSHSSIDYHGGRADGLDVGMRLVKSILNDLMDQSSLDIVECNHCEYSKLLQDVENPKHIFRYCSLMNGFVTDSSFCSYGK